MIEESSMSLLSKNDSNSLLMKTSERLIHLPKSISFATIGLILMLSIFTRFSPATNAADPPAVFYVAPPPATATGTPGGSCSTPGFNKIQDAVNAAPPGSLIIVCPGTYTEQVTVTKTLSLSGSGPSRTPGNAPGILLPDTSA